MYVIRTDSPWRAVLTEMTAAEYRTARVAFLAGTGPGVQQVSAEEARRWVRAGFDHETGLYLDGNRIRYARPNT